MHNLRCHFSVRESLKPLCLFLVLLLFRITKAELNLTTIEFKEGYSALFGHDNGNLVHSPDDKSVRLLLDRFTGSGFISSSMYHHGFFSAKIKLPGDHTAGIVVAFYASNGGVFEKTHDELDFEFLGNIPGKPWRFQTNLYGNGSTHKGREERYRLWFDPSKDFHRYSILWTSNIIIFYIDDVPIREIKRNPEMGIEFPSKPMSIYATIWDASSWATDGGKYKVNYKYAPFVTEFKDFALDGCPVDTIQEFPAESCIGKDIELEDKDYATITLRQQGQMRKFRHKYMYYSYCYDILRYHVPPPECVIDSLERERFKDTGRLKFGDSHKETAQGRHGRKHGRSRNSRDSPVEADMSY